MAGVLDYAPALSTKLNVDDTGNTFAGVLNGSLKVYIDPYYASVSTRPTGVTGGEGYFPTKNRIQNSLRHGFKPIRRSDSGIWIGSYFYQLLLQIIRSVKSSISRSNSKS